tara:strand:+ start:7257 stop:7625 length:369 start_codon:yes stop_codon:yes gene_type:complete
MKTPKELNKIYNRLPKDKTELAIHKVELAGIADRAIKFTEDLEKGNRNFMTDYMAVIEESIKKGEKELNRLGAVYRLAKKTETQLIEGLKDLGVSKSPLLDNLRKVIDRYENYVLKQSKRYF